MRIVAVCNSAKFQQIGRVCFRAYIALQCISNRVETF